MSGAAETHLILVWETARPALDRILEDARRRFVIRDVVEVTWRRERFRRSLSRLYGTDLPPDSDKERESGTGPFVVVVVDDVQPRTVARKTERGWTPANAALLAAKRRYRAWSGGSGSYRVHATLTSREASKDAVLILGESPEALGHRTWNGIVRQRRREPLGDPDWTSLDELETALAATMRCAFPAAEQPDAPFEVVTDDAWWAIRIIDPAVAEGRQEPDERLRRPIVAGAEQPVHVRDVTDPDADPTWSSLLPEADLARAPTVADRVAALARRRS